jgi:hypothetical protein
VQNGTSPREETGTKTTPLCVSNIASRRSCIRTHIRNAASGTTGRHHSRVAGRVRGDDKDTGLHVPVHTVCRSSARSVNDARSEPLGNGADAGLRAEVHTWYGPVVARRSLDCDGRSARYARNVHRAVSHRELGNLRMAGSLSVSSHSGLDVAAPLFHLPEQLERAGYTFLQTAVLTTYSHDAPS